MTNRWGATLREVKAIGTPEEEPGETPAPPMAQASLPPPVARERMIDRRDGVRRTIVEYVPGKIRGGKRSGRWGRGTEEARQGDWVGASLPKGYGARLNRLALAHDLHAWQVLVEAIDLFAKTHGEEPSQ
jgi:hypothetical protein